MAETEKKKFVYFCRTLRKEPAKFQEPTVNEKGAKRGLEGGYELAPKQLRKRGESGSRSI